jgi:hypothetical protein
MNDPELQPFAVAGACAGLVLAILIVIAALTT